MSTEHTQGPWAVTQSHYPSITEISGPSFGIKAVMWATDLTEEDYQKRLADLRLIAAAPDLLEALQDAYEILGISYPLTAPDSDKRSLVLSKTRAAIAKATGEK